MINRRQSVCVNVIRLRGAAAVQGAESWTLAMSYQSYRGDPWCDSISTCFYKIVDDP